MAKELKLTKEEILRSRMNVNASMGFTESDMEYETEYEDDVVREYDDGGEALFNVQSVYDRRIKHGKIQYKVKWVGYGSEDDTWEPAESFISKGSKLAVYQYHERLLLEQKQSKLKSTTGDAVKESFNDDKENGTKHQGFKEGGRMNSFVSSSQHRRFKNKISSGLDHDQKKKSRTNSFDQSLRAYSKSEVNTGKRHHPDDISSMGNSKKLKHSTTPYPSLSLEDFKALKNEKRIQREKAEQKRKEEQFKQKIDEEREKQRRQLAAEAVQRKLTLQKALKLAEKERLEAERKKIAAREAAAFKNAYDYVANQLQSSDEENDDENSSMNNA